MESFEPELARKVLGRSEEDEYSEDFRQHLASSPVFEHAHILQREFLTTRLKKEDFIAVWNAAHDSIISLDSEADAQGVLYQNISLKGEGILVPKFEVDFAAGIAMTSLIDKEVQQARSFQSYLQPDEFHGKFAGFTIRFAEAPEEQGAYIPVLCYRVSLSMGHFSYAEVSLFATGDVGTTGLHFDADERFEGALGPLNELFKLCGEKAESINRINMTLSSTEVYDSSCMRHVAYHAEKIVNNVEKEKRPEVEDALADLIAHYIGRSSSYLIQTGKFVRSPESADAGMSYCSSDQLYAFHSVCSDVIFLDMAIIQNGEVTFSGKRSIHLALPQEDRTTYIPMIGMQVFEKQ